ncbi:MAG: phosphoglycerate mutase, partial [Candidatus Dadabacteria bacterium]
MSTPLTRLQLLQQLAQPGEPMLLIVLDGVGGLPQAGKTALGHAVTPTLDDLARHSNLGLIDPVFRGITPGSGIGHLGLFGYDVLETRAERGVLEALGVGLDLSDGAVAVRGNFVTLDSDGNITDRRAGRISSEEGARVVARLADAITELDGVPVELRLVKEYRFALVLRDASLGGNIDDTDPQKTGVPPLAAHARDEQSRRTAELLDLFASRAREILADEPAANGVTMRGIGKKPDIPTFQELYGMSSAVVAHYPMYRGAANLVGMEIIDVEGEGEA